MRINSLDDIKNNMGYIVHAIDNYKKHSINKKKLIYNCSPTRMKDGNVKNTFIEVGYLYLFSRVEDDSQGFVYFDCVERINYDNDHKIYSEKIPEQISDKIVGKFNTYIAQIYNDKTKEYLNKDSNIEWHLNKGQALFTSKKEADEYIEQCKAGEVEIKNFYLKIEQVQ